MVIVAGEASADLHGSKLVKAMKEKCPHLRFVGIGGPLMREAGVEILVSSSEMAVVGFSEVFAKLGRISNAYFRLKSLLRHQRPNLLILIDYPEFNLRVAKQAKKCHVPVLYYISPQVWAWRSGRVKQIVQRVDKLAVILPFEEEFFRQKGVNVEYVGHPLLDQVPEYVDPVQTKVELGMETFDPIIGILPGSRKEEVRSLLPAMVRAAEIISSEYESLACILPLAPTIDSNFVSTFLDKAGARVKLFKGDIYKALSVCRVGMVSSGTATLQLAMAGVPMVIAYRISPISYWIARKVVRVRHIGLVNLVAGKEVAPELIQDEVTGENLAKALLPMLRTAHREKVMRNLNMVREALGRGGASQKTAELALDLMA